MSIATDVMALARQLGWSRTQTAKYTGCHPLHVSRWSAQARIDAGEPHLSATSARTPSVSVLHFMRACRVLQQHGLLDEFLRTIL